MVDPQRPRSLSIVELLVASIRLYRNNFPSFILITALVLVPYNLLTFVLADSTTPLSMTELLTYAWRGTPRPNGGGWPSLIYNLIVQPIMYGTLILAAAQCYRQQPVSIESNFQTARIRWTTLLGVAFQKLLVWIAAWLAGTVLNFFMWFPLDLIISDELHMRYATSGLSSKISVGLSLLVPLCIGVRLIVAAQAVLIEDRFASDSIVRSWKLTQHNWWRTATFAVVVLLLQLGAPALIVGAAMTGIEQLVLDTQLVAALQMALVTIAQIVALPLSFIAHTLLFFDLRIRTEGFDPEHDPLAPHWNDGEYPSWLNA